MAVESAGIVKETWWHTVIVLGDGFTSLRSLQNQTVFDALSLFGGVCALWAAWKVVRADLIDTAILKETRKDLNKSKTKQVREARSRYAKLLIGQNLTTRGFPIFISNLFTLAIASYALTKGGKGEYDAGIAKQFATLEKKEKSQRLKARARLLGALSLISVASANLIKPDPISKSEKEALYKLSTGQLAPAKYQ